VLTSPRWCTNLAQHEPVGAQHLAAGDRVRYDVETPGAKPFTIEAELLYQSIGYRWAHNLRAPPDHAHLRVRR
jgi:hypothetical protein